MNNYQIKLLPNELFWLAKSLRVDTLHLYNNPISQITLYKTREEFAKAQETLKTRGLIKSSEYAWQVDRLLVAVIRLLSLTEYRIDAQITLRDGQSHRASIFIESEMYMFVIRTDEELQFTFFRNQQVLTSSLLDWINTFESLSTNDKADSVSHTLPQPDTLIPLTWRDNKIIKSVLQRNGFNVEKTKKAIKWMTSQKFILTLSKVRFAKNATPTELICNICGDGRTIWFGDFDANQTELITSLSPIEKNIEEQLTEVLYKAIAPINSLKNWETE